MPIVVALAACSKEPTTSSATSSARETAVGVVRVAVPEEQKGKVFRGVMLERDGGEQWVLAYDADVLWRAFDGRRVVVTGERYVPVNQALLDPHFRAASWRVETPGAEDVLESVGEERSLTGVFTVVTVPEGAKLAGDRMPMFVSGDTSYHVDTIPGVAANKKTVTIKAREIVSSRFTAHVGGPALHVIEVVR